MFMLPVAPVTNRVRVNRPVNNLSINHPPGWDCWRTYPWSPYNAWRNRYWNPYWCYPGWYFPTWVNPFIDVFTDPF